jgi:predicted alpha/beta superfamily hydrolase
MTGIAPAYAGADEFLRVILTEIKPRVAAAAPVNPDRSTVFGHSLGGLFVLHALFTHPDAFQTWLALSPSIWWDSRVVLRDEAAFAGEVAAGHVAPRIYIGVGAREESKPDEFMMVTNASALASRLSGLKGAPSYVVGSKVFDGQTHLSVPIAAAGALLDFALPPGAPPAR